MFFLHLRNPKLLIAHAGGALRFYYFAFNVTQDTQKEFYVHYSLNLLFKFCNKLLLKAWESELTNFKVEILVCGNLEIVLCPHAVMLVSWIYFGLAVYQGRLFPQKRKSADNEPKDMQMRCSGKMVKCSNRLCLLFSHWKLAIAA